ncbi:MAG TPA: hypothetical protein PKD83_01175 [Ignavibacteria bacterium]|nr:hypothetical protein [Ignavibacteria bacterium]
MKKILTAFDDPGGGLAVSSILRELLKMDTTELIIYSGKLSEKFVNDLPFRNLKSDLTEDESETIVNETDPDMILTSTGAGRAEQELRNTAYRKNIKSIVILDYWKDYKRRWKFASYKLSEMRDKVCVMDELTKNEMISEGFPAENLFVTGHTYLDKIFNERVSNLKLNKNKFSPDSEENDKSKIDILFLSQPLDIIGIKNFETHPLEILLRALTELSDNEGKSISLTIKPHPIETDLKELKVISGEYKCEEINIRFSESTEHLNTLITDSDIVVGYNTIAMFEARALNKKTISLNASPVRNSLRKAMEQAGIEITDCRETEIIKSLNSNKDSKKVSGTFTGGIKNCITLIKSDLNLN